MGIRGLASFLESKGAYKEIKNLGNNPKTLVVSFVQIFAKV
jgi:hypothetical protein